MFFLQGSRPDQVSSSSNGARDGAELTVAGKFPEKNLAINPNNLIRSLWIHLSVLLRLRARLLNLFSGVILRGLFTPELFRKQYFLF